MDHRVPRQAVVVAVRQMLPVAAAQRRAAVELVAQVVQRVGLAQRAALALGMLARVVLGRLRRQRAMLAVPLPQAAQAVDLAADAMARQRRPVRVVV